MQSAKMLPSGLWVSGRGLEGLEGLSRPVIRDPRIEEMVELARATKARMSAPSYIIYNSAMATTAAPVKQPTGNAIRTMMQLALSSTYPAARVIAWGASYDASALATPGQVELIETNVAATGLSTAYAAADIQPYANAKAPANTAGSSGVPFNLSTSTSGFATGAVTEGSTTTSRMADMQQLDPVNNYVYQWPLAREFELTPGNFLRVRNTFGASVNAWYYVVVEC